MYVVAYEIKVFSDMRCFVMFVTAVFFISTKVKMAEK